MIAKAGTGSSFGGALGYLLSEDKQPEVIHSQELFSRAVEDGPPRVAGEMQACAAQSTRCTKPVYHLSLSWAPEDNPTPEQVAATSRRFLRDLGLQEHQAVVVRHYDTAHAHVHIVVNRVNPYTGKAWKPPHWQRGLHVLCRRVEREMGWRVVSSERAPDRARPTAREQSAWRHRGVEPLAQKISRACGDQLCRARTWHGLEHVLKAHGYAIAPSGRWGGLVFTDGKRLTSASRVHRELSRPKLERRFGLSLEEARSAVRGFREGRLGRGLDKARADAERVRERPVLGWGRSRDDGLGL